MVGTTHISSSSDGGTIENFIEIRHFIIVLPGSIYTIQIFDNIYVYISEILLEQ